MRKQTILFFFFLFSIPTFGKIGINGNYSIVSQKDYEKKVSKGYNVALSKFIIVPGYNKKYKDISEVKNKYDLFAIFSFMLKKNKISKMEEYVSKCDTAFQINNLICGLYYFSQKQYLNALVYFENYMEEDFQFLKYLLIADINYELLENKNNYKLALQLYQEAFDISKREQEKTIVNNRIKNIKYRS